MNDLPKLIGLVKAPKWNLYNYYALEEGKKVSNIFYAGDGGDEFFGGYTFRLGKFLSSLTDQMGWKEKCKR